MVQKERNSKIKTYCVCNCDCGNKEKIVRPISNIKRAKNPSCGCARAEINNSVSRKVVGEKFGRLLVLEEIDSCSPRKLKCICDCGNIVIRSKSDITSLHTQSCGCLHYEKFSLGKEKDWTNQISELGVKALCKDYQNDKGQWLWEFVCPLCQNVFTSLPIKVFTNHTTSCGCRIKSSYEDFIEQILVQNNILYKTQYSFENCKYKKKLRFDFALKNNKGEVFYLIEFDGMQHFKPIEYFGGVNNFNEQIIRDSIKNKFCKENNIPLLRLSYKQELKEIEKLIINIINP